MMEILNLKSHLLIFINLSRFLRFLWSVRFIWFMPMQSTEIDEDDNINEF